MARLIIECSSLKQAEELGNFYEGYGEQIADEWMIEHGVRAPYTDCQRKNGCMEIDKETETVILYTKTFDLKNKQ